MNLKKKDSFQPTILRFATAFGHSERMRYDLTINQFVFELYKKGFIEVYDYNTWRPYCHTKDFARIIELVFNSKLDDIYFEVFNAGSNNNNFTKRGIVEEIQKYVDGKKVIFLEKGNDPRNYKVNFDKIRNLGFDNEISVNEGIKELVSRLNQDFFRTDYTINSYGNYEIER